MTFAITLDWKLAYWIVIVFLAYLVIANVESAHRHYKIRRRKWKLFIRLFAIGILISVIFEFMCRILELTLNIPYIP